jgi:hypothetical protein
MHIPMRLAITDKDYSAGDEDDAEQQAGAASYAAQDEERPWSVRLAGKLLGLAAQGAACPWRPYLRVLPERVPSPLTTFSWEDVQAIEVRSRCLYAPCFLMGVCYCSAPILFRKGHAAKLSEYLGSKPWPVITAAALRAPHLPLAAPRPPLLQYEPMRRQLDHASWLASSACQQQQVEEEGSEVFSREQWEWALSVSTELPCAALRLGCCMPLCCCCSICSQLVVDSGTLLAHNLLQTGLLAPSRFPCLRAAGRPLAHLWRAWPPGQRGRAHAGASGGHAKSRGRLHHQPAWFQLSRGPASGAGL